MARRAAANEPKTWRIAPLLGGLNTIAEINSLQAFANPKDPGAVCEFSDIENFAPLERGGLRKSFGFSAYISTGTSSPITGIVRFQKSDGTNQFIYAQGTHVYQQGNVTPIATIASGATVNFCIGNDILVICDGSSQVQWWDGTTLHTNANTSLPAGCIACIFYQNRFWFFTSFAGDQSNVYYSAPNDIAHGYGDLGPSPGGLGGIVQCDYNDGQNVTAICNFFMPNSLNQSLGVAKSGSFGVIIGNGTTANPYTFLKTDFVMGVQSSRAVVASEQYLFYFTHRGLAQYDASQPYINLKSGFPGEKIRNTILSLPNNTANQTICWYDWQNFRIGCAVAETGFSYPNVIYFYDVRYGCWYKERWGGSNNMTSVFIDTDFINGTGSPGTWYHGDSNGNIYIHGSIYGSFNGTAISSYFTLPYLDFGDAASYKQIAGARTTLSGGSQVNVTVNYNLDYGDRMGKANTLAASESPYVWGGGVWTSDPTVYQWGGATVANRRYYPSCYARTIQPTFSHADTSNDLSIYEISYDILYSGMR